MKSTSYDWHNQMVEQSKKIQWAGKPLEWSGKHFDSNPIRIRRDLAKFNKIREKNVPIGQVIVATITTFFKGF